jgi:hypothetical protein
MLSGSSLVAAATIDAAAQGGNTRDHEYAAEQELVVAELKGEGGWLTCS